MKREAKCKYCRPAFQYPFSVGSGWVSYPMIQPDRQFHPFSAKIDGARQIQHPWILTKNRYAAFQKWESTPRRNLHCELRGKAKMEQGEEEKGGEENSGEG